MYTPDNLAYNLDDLDLYEEDHTEALRDLSEPYIPADTCPHQSRRRHPGKRKRNSRRQLLKRVLPASILTLSLAAGAGLHILWTQNNTFVKISSPAFFSNLDIKQPSSLNDLQQGQKQNSDLNQNRELVQDQDKNASEDDRTVHIASVSNEWNLILVNPWNPVPSDYEINLISIGYGHSVDARCYPDLQNMLADCRSVGLYPLVCSSYRTMEMQKELFKERVEELTAQGYSKKAAKKKAATSVAKPGTSEHQLGLAVDIVDQNHQLLDSSQEQTLVQQWLMQNSWKYGFILRYPNGTSDLTGIIYEPWHYRYVGKKAAKEIYDQGVCLEEYLQNTVQP